MKTAILGGSFDPIHNGHLTLATEVLQKTEYERILFIPAGTPPHKSLSDFSSNHQRLEMLELALESYPAFESWDGEIVRGGRSYSIDTVRELKKLGFVEGLPGLIIGDDLVDGFRNWRESERLSVEARIVLARRLNIPPDELPFSCLKLDNKIWPLSSTEVRELICSGDDFSSLIPSGVARYIRENSLYGYRG